MSALADTLRETEPGTLIRLLLRDGGEITGPLLSVNGESVALDYDGGTRVDLSEVKRLKLEFTMPAHGAARKQAA